MPKRNTPITVFCATSDEAQRLWYRNPEDSRPLVKGPGTLTFHKLIAQHGAGEFTTLYVPLALKGSFKPPAGGVIKNLGETA